MPFYAYTIKHMRECDTRVTVHLPDGMENDLREAALAEHTSVSANIAAAGSRAFTPSV
jgi:hypothetical protein